MSDASDRLAQRLERIYQRLTEHQVDAYLVPSSDAHLNEYVPTYQCRRAAISGFTGSAGDVLLSPHGNHLFVDSRYYLQAEQEVDTGRFRVHKVGLADAYTLKGWLTEMEKQHGTLRVGFDPFLHPMASHASYAKALSASGSALVPIDANLIDEVWEDRPAAPAQPIYALPDEVTGRPVGDKLAAIRQKMSEAGAAALIVTKAGRDRLDYQPAGQRHRLQPGVRVLPDDRDCPRHLLHPRHALRGIATRPCAARRFPGV